MRAGRLRNRVVIQRRTGAVNAFNEPTDTWSALATVWAGIEPISGREYFAAQQVQSELTHRVTIRYLEGVTPKDRVAWTDPATQATRYFDIRAVIDRDERHREQQLMCVEHAGSFTSN
ncbi:MAG TPA: phage head closure protein [Dehalococcoidia bacterium]|mgnify:CR=1 FL=1|nr:phage head closure protein [Dehalococcoidia bacterium]